MDKFFFGSAISSVDEQGGVVLPAGLIETLKKREHGGVLFVGRHEDGLRLVAYDKAHFDDQQAGIDWQYGALMGGTREKHEQFLFRTFTLVERVQLTDIGQLIISPMMRDCGRIGRDVLCVGVGCRFELWDLQTVLEHGPSDLRWAARHHLRARAIVEKHAVSAQPGVQSLQSSATTMRKRRLAPMHLADMGTKALPQKAVGHQIFVSNRPK